MKKTILAMSLAAVLSCGVASAEPAYQKDIQLFNQNEIVLNQGVAVNGEETTINAMAKDLGALVKVRRFKNQWDFSVPTIQLTHGFYENGEVWLKGNVKEDEKAPVARLVTKRTDVATAKGLKVGDSFSKIMELYGEPQYIHWNELCNDDNKEVDRWFVYFCQDQYEKGTLKENRPAVTKLLIGIKGKTVSRIGYSGVWNMGL